MAHRTENTYSSALYRKFADFCLRALELTVLDPVTWVLKTLLTGKFYHGLNTVLYNRNLMQGVRNLNFFIFT